MCGCGCVCLFQEAVEGLQGEQHQRPAAGGAPCWCVERTHFTLLPQICLCVCRLAL